MYCYGKAYALDSNHVDAMWDRASLAKEVGDMRVVRIHMTSSDNFLPGHL